MSTSNAIVRARNTPAATPAGAPPPIVPTDELTARLNFANALSKAGPVLPACYRNNPGAVLALMSWAERHGKDILSAGQGVYVSDQGQLLVSAEMRVELANDRGYDIVDITDDARRREECTVEVRTPAGDTHRLTVRLADIPDSVKGPTKNGKPSTWMLNPEDMLLRTAQRRADKRFCRSAAVVIDANADDWADSEPADPVDVIHDDSANQPTTGPAEDIAEDDVVDAEVIEPDDHDPLTAPPVTEEDLRAAAKVPDILRAATKLGANVALVADVVADQELARAVLAEVAG